MSRLDFVIFAASGFTGKCLVKEAIRISAGEKNKMSWGVAGRSASKLSETLKKIHNETGADLSNIKVLIADACNEESLKEMASQAKVLINCCGPFRYYGEQVVKACIDTKTHYVDITAEIQFMQNMQLKYSAAAEEAGVYVVSACGMDCIPTDLGVVFLQQNFKGVLNSVESFMTVDIPRKYMLPGTALVNYGTYESLFTMIAYNREREILNQKLYPDPASVPHFQTKIKKRSRFSKKFGHWILPSALADEEVVYRTQHHFYKTQNQRPVQFKSYIGIPNLLEMLALCILLPIAYLMCKVGLTRRLLLRYPRLFTLGFISRKGVKDKVMNSMKMVCYLRGEGWNESEPQDNMPPNKVMVAKVTGMNPGYVFTAVATLHAALTILRESHNMPPKGGVLTTGIAFANTSFIQTLHDNDYKFEIVS